MKKGERTIIQIENILKNMDFLPEPTKSLVKTYVEFLNAKKEGNTYDFRTFISTEQSSMQFSKEIIRLLESILGTIENPGVKELENFYAFLTYVNDHRIEIPPQSMINAMTLFLEKRVTITKSEIELMDILSTQTSVSWKVIYQQNKNQFTLPQVRIRELISDLRKKALISIKPVIDYNRFGLESIVFLSHLVQSPYAVMPSHPYMDDHSLFPLPDPKETIAISSYQIPQIYRDTFISNHKELVDKTIQVKKIFTFKDMYSSMNLRYLRARPLLNPATEARLILFQLLAVKDQLTLELPVRNLWEFHFFTADRDFIKDRGEQRIEFGEEELTILENAYSSPTEDTRVFPPRNLIAERSSTSVRRVAHSLERFTNIKAVQWRITLGIPSLQKTTVVLIGNKTLTEAIGKALMNSFPYSVVKHGESLDGNEGILKAEYYHDPLIPATDMIQKGLTELKNEFSYILLTRYSSPTSDFKANYLYRGARWIWDERSKLGFSISL